MVHDTTISRQAAHKLVDETGGSWDEFVAEYGDRKRYWVSILLAWLGQ